MCGSKLLSRNSLRMHINQFHLKRKCIKIYCDLCPRSFDRKNLLAFHLKTYHLKVRRFDCKICGFKCYYRSNLKAHMICHESKVKCKVCKKFVANLKYHMQNHIKVKCPICSKVLAKPNLSEHVKTHDKTGKGKRK